MTTGKTLKMLKWEEALTFYGSLFVSARDSETGKKVIDIPMAADGEGAIDIF